MALLVRLAVIVAAASFCRHQVVATRKEHIGVTKLGMIELMEENKTNELLVHRRTNGSLEQNRSGVASGSILGLDCKAAIGAGKWTFFYKEWCPFSQVLLQKLKEFGKLAEFRDNNIMKCFSGFEDVIAAMYPMLPTSDIPHRVNEFMIENDFIDPNEGGGNVPCEYKFSKGDSNVYNEMEAAHLANHDVSCGAEYPYFNSPHTVPALVIGGKKYCQTGELLSWIKRCEPELTWKKSYSEHQHSTQFVIIMMVASILFWN